MRKSNLNHESEIWESTRTARSLQPIFFLGRAHTSNDKIMKCDISHHLTLSCAILHSSSICREHCTKWLARRWLINPFRWCRACRPESKPECPSPSLSVRVLGLCSKSAGPCPIPFLFSNRPPAAHYSHSKSCQSSQRGIQTIKLQFRDTDNKAGGAGGWPQRQQAQT